jgi:4-hydroxy-tetrahydrodipicolinate synthase
MMPLAHDALRGSYPPLVTPFRDGEVDYDAFARLVEHVIANGTHGILVTGTTGEPSTLTVDERTQLLRVAIETAAGRVPVVAATGSQSLAETLDLTVRAEQAGADAVLVVTPYYIRPPQRGLAAYFIAVGERISLPMLIYHIPGRAAVSIEVDTMERIAERVPHMVGVKHAAQDLAFVTALFSRFGKDFRVFVGLEELSLPMLAVGATGLMNAAGNVAPRQVARLCELVAAGDLAGAQDLHNALFELNQAIFFDTNPIPLKYMLKRLGIQPRNEHRLPMVPATPEIERRLDAVLERAGLLTPAAR